MSCANIFKKLAAGSSPRDQLITIYSVAKRVNGVASNTNDKVLINKSNGLFQLASRLLWNADNHGVTASFFAGMLGKMSGLSSDISSYLGKQRANPFGSTPAFEQMNNSINSFDVALSRAIPVNMTASKPKAAPKPVNPSEDFGPDTRQPLKPIQDRMTAENTGLPPSGVIGQGYDRTIPGLDGGRVKADLGLGPSAPQGAAFKQEEPFDWTDKSYKVKEPPKAPDLLPLSEEEKAKKPWEEWGS